ncbi:MAG: hypothetical protein WCD18_19125 [Thermosynechococcaceae cyanobacterium]
MTASMLPSDNDRIERLETLMERLININLSTQSQIGFLADTLKDTRERLARVDDRLAHLDTGFAETNQKLAETNRKIDIILKHITGIGGDSQPS